MLWLYLLAVVLLGIVVAALLGRWEGATVPGEESDPAESDVDDLLRRRADRHITAVDLQEIRLDSAVRGYRMDQVDRLLDALGAQLDELQQLQQVRAERPQGAPEVTAEPRHDRSQTLIDPDMDSGGPAQGAPDKDLSQPSQPDPKP